MSSETRIARADRAQWFATLHLVFSHLAEPERQQQVSRILSEAEAGRESLEGLWGAYEGGRLMGAGLAIIQPGRTASVWLPRSPRGENAEPIAEQLLAAVDEWLFGQDVQLAQVLVETASDDEDRLLRRRGFQPLTDLLYLVCQENEFPNVRPITRLDFEPYSQDNHQRLVALVDATYQQTLDCPQLNGVRDTEDVLAGYRVTGEFDAARWLLVRHEGQDVGCLLLADHVRDENWELVYMGVVPDARGQGWGIEIVHHAQWLTRCAARPRLVLAVDAANEPAIRMYAVAGFQAWDRRTVYVKAAKGKRLGV